MLFFFFGFRIQGKHHLLVFISYTQQKYSFCTQRSNTVCVFLFVRIDSVLRGTLNIHI